MVSTQSEAKVQNITAEKNAMRVRQFRADCSRSGNPSDIKCHHARRPNNFTISLPDIYFTAYVGVEKRERMQQMLEQLGSEFRIYPSTFICL